MLSLSEMITLTGEAVAPVEQERRCLDCRAVLAPENQLYCGATCRRRTRWKRQLRNRERRGVPTHQGNQVSAAMRAWIFERDDWTCQLCFKPIDPAAPTNTDWSPTLDHIIELARGGPSVAGNLRATHRICNGARNLPADDPA